MIRSRGQKDLFVLVEIHERIFFYKNLVGNKFFLKFQNSWPSFTSRIFHTRNIDMHLAVTRDSALLAENNFTPRVSINDESKIMQYEVESWRFLHTLLRSVLLFSFLLRASNLQRPRNASMNEVEKSVCVSQHRVVVLRPDVYSTAKKTLSLYTLLYTLSTSIFLYIVCI